MMWIPGDRADFDSWPEGWRWPDLQPYLRRVEDEACSITPLADPNPMSQAFLESVEEAGVAGRGNLRPESLEGASLVRVTQRRGLRCSAADNYLKPAKGRPNLTVLTESQVTGISFDGSRATGVRYRRDCQEDEAPAGREVILAAGAIGSPQLLMLSGVGPADHLRERGVQLVRDLADVGQGLQDHPMAISLFDASGKDSLYAAESPKQLLRLLVRRRGMLTSNVGEAAAFVRAAGGVAPDLELIFAPVLYVEEGLVPPPAHGFSIASVCLQPHSRGSVRLRSADPREAPDIDPGSSAIRRTSRSCVRASSWREGSQRPRRSAAGTRAGARPPTPSRATTRSPVGSAPTRTRSTTRSRPARSAVSWAPTSASAAWRGCGSPTRR
jgi:choline dehydrogenase